MHQEIARRFTLAVAFTALLIPVGLASFLLPSSTVALVLWIAYLGGVLALNFYYAASECPLCGAGIGWMRVRWDGYTKCQSCFGALRIPLSSTIRFKPIEGLRE